MKILQNAKTTLFGAAALVSMFGSIAQTTYGIFEENDNVTDGVTIGGNADLFIWSDTYSAVSDEPNYVGEGTLAFEPSNGGSAGWAGFGLALKSRTDLTAFTDGYLNFSIKVDASQTADFEVGLDCHSGAYLVQFKAGSEPISFARDGQWHDLSIALKDLTPSTDPETEVTAPAMGDTTLVSVNNVFRVGGLVKFAVDEVYLTTEAPTAVFDTKNEALSFYPNPASDFIVLPEVQGIKDITVIDLLGNVIFETKATSSNRIDLSALETGMYMIQVSNDSKSWSSVFNKQ